MEEAQIKQAFKESILFRENAISKFEEQLGSQTFAAASKILETLKVKSLAELKEQVMDGTVPTDILKVEPVKATNGNADSPAEAEENKDVPDHQSEQSTKENLDPSATAGSDNAGSPAEAEENKSIPEHQSEQTYSEGSDNSLAKVIDVLTNIETRLAALEKSEESEISTETVDEDEETNTEAVDEDKNDDESNTESADGDKDDLSDDELPEPPAMTEASDNDETEKEKVTNKESVDAKNVNFKELFTKL